MIKNKEALFGIFGFLLDAVSPPAGRVSNRISDTVKGFLKVNIFDVTKTVAGSSSMTQEVGDQLYDMVTTEGAD